MTDNKIVKRKFQPGDQIAYVPLHANGDVNHPDAQYGFVVKENPRMPGVYFCRYYYREHVDPAKSLRTKANSEGTSEDMLVFHKHTQYTKITMDWMTWVQPITGDPLPIAFEDFWQDTLEARQEAYMDAGEDYDLLESGEESE